MTNEEAIAIIRKEYLCVDRDCDIDRSCGKCDLMMPTKEPILEAYNMAIKALKQEPCDDAISRQAVLDVIEELKKIHFDRIVVLNKVRDRVLDLPPINPQEPKTGHWEWLTEDKYRCSNCNHETRVDECMNKTMYDYCPFCGASMFEPQESEVSDADSD